MAMAGITIFFVSLINIALPVALLCLLQYFLSKMESPWPGRVLPILSGASALGINALLLFNLASMAVTNIQNNVHVIVHRSGVAGLIISALLLWLPMVLYIVIYRRTRRNFITKKNMEKMSIQDLE